MHPVKVGRRTLIRAEDSVINFRVGSKAEVQRGPRNVRFRGLSGSRFQATGGLLLAEAVEEVGAERFFAIIVLASRA